jgi:TatA/E family protein of Tat protein translocase
MPILLAIFDFGTSELLVIGAIAVLLYGKNLPDAARSIGKQLGTFKKGLSGIEEEIRSSTGGLVIPPTKFTRALSTLDVLTKNSASSTLPSSSYSGSRPAVHEAVSDLEEPTAPKFEPPSNT